ncbi:hypothetical protein E2C01_005956 [Portunus trituberculatus]|uniref:Uncharacterized protein n=1 Tax=Portunus trituberculatus TaxID=210409 RepID=A0A5B7CWK6_PORTR|nr:hypothetical protein [Portunus trituberculatus]
MLPLKKTPIYKEVGMITARKEKRIKRRYTDKKRKKRELEGGQCQGATKKRREPVKAGDWVLHKQPGTGLARGLAEPRLPGTLISIPIQSIDQSPNCGRLLKHY